MSKAVDVRFAVRHPVLLFITTKVAHPELSHIQARVNNPLRFTISPIQDFLIEELSL